MNCEDKSGTGTCEDRGFGVMGEILRTLQEEELEQAESQQLEMQEIAFTKKIMETLIEMDTTLKEILDIQKQILEEIKKSKLE
jgi:hypothetical protein